MINTSFVMGGLNSTHTVATSLLTAAYRRSRGAKVINTSFVMGDLNVPLKDAVGNATQAGIFFSA